MGEQRVKNIAKPVRVYCVRMGVEAVEAAQAPAVRWVARRWFRPGRAIAAFAIAALAVAIFMGPPATSDPGMTPAVAVLPLQAIGDEAAQAEFGEGLTEDLIVALSAHTDLRVVRSDEPGSPQEVGARLHVAYVLDGRIRHAGETLRITAQLPRPRRATACGADATTACRPTCWSSKRRSPQICRHARPKAGRGRRHENG